MYKSLRFHPTSVYKIFVRNDACTVEYIHYKLKRCSNKERYINNVDMSSLQPGNVLKAKVHKCNVRF